MMSPKRLQVTITSNLVGSRTISIEEVARLDRRVFLADFLEDALPEIVSEGHRVVLVAHADALKIAGGGVLEGVADDAFDALAGIHVFLDGDLVGRVLFEEAANADVEAFRVFAKDDELKIFLGAAAQR